MWSRPYLQYTVYVYECYIPPAFISVCMRNKERVMSISPWKPSLNGSRKNINPDGRPQRNIPAFIFENFLNKTQDDFRLWSRTEIKWIFRDDWWYGQAKTCPLPYHVHTVCRQGLGFRVCRLVPGLLSASEKSSSAHLTQILSILVISLTVLIGRAPYLYSVTSDYFVLKEWLIDVTLLFLCVGNSLFKAATRKGFFFLLANYWRNCRALDLFLRSAVSYTDRSQWQGQRKPKMVLQFGAINVQWTCYILSAKLNSRMKAMGNKSAHQSSISSLLLNDKTWLICVSAETLWRLS